MAIEAPLSRYKKSNYKIWMAGLIGLTVIFAYDGYLSEYSWSHRRSFYEEHTRKPLGELPTSLTEGLDAGPISPDLSGEFEKVGVSLSSDATVSVSQADLQWDINDGAETYTIVKDQDKAELFKVEPDGIMLFNRLSPPVFVAMAVVLTVLYRRSKNGRVTAEENELIVNGKRRIPYDAIQKIDKTHFERKGFFTIVYQLDGRGETKLRLSDRQYDNLKAILDHLVDQIT